MCVRVLITGDIHDCMCGGILQALRSHLAHGNKKHARSHFFFSLLSLSSERVGRDPEVRHACLECENTGSSDREQKDIVPAVISFYNLIYPRMRQFQNCLEWYLVNCHLTIVI